MSQSNQDQILHQDDYQNYRRSRSKDQIQSDPSVVIETSESEQVDKVSLPETGEPQKISIAWKHQIYIFFFSALLSIFSVSLPLFSDFANGLQSQNLYTGMMFANGSLPYADFFSTGGFLYYFLISLAYRLGSTLWLIPVQFLSYALSGIFLYRTVMHMTSRKELAAFINLIFFVINGTLGFGGLYPIQFAMPFILAAIWFLTRYFSGSSRDEAFILYGLAGTAGALFEARSLIFWILSLLTIFVYNAVNKHFARGFYQVLCIVFGNILVLYFTLYFILNLQITTDYINQVLTYNFTQFAIENHSLLLTLPFQFIAILGSGLLLGALTTGNHLLGDAKDKSIKWVLLLSFVLTALYSLFSQSFGLYSILNLVPYGLVLTALSLDDILSRRGNRTSRHRKSSRESSLKILGVFLSRNLFLPIVVFAFGFAFPIIMFLFNLGNNVERQQIGDYIAKNTKADETIYVYDSSAKIYTASERKAAAPFVIPTINTAKASNQQAIADALLQNTAKYIVVYQDTQLPSEVTETLSNHYETASVDGINRFTIYRLK